MLKRGVEWEKDQMWLHEGSLMRRLSGLQPRYLNSEGPLQCRVALLVG